MKIDSKRNSKLKYASLLLFIFLYISNYISRASDYSDCSDYSLADSESELILTEIKPAYDDLKSCMNIISQKIFNNLPEEKKEKFQKTIEAYSSQISCRIYGELQNKVQTLEIFQISKDLEEERKCLKEYSQEKIEMYLRQIAQGKTSINEHPELALVNIEIKKIIDAALIEDITFKEGKIIDEFLLRWAAIRSFNDKGIVLYFP